MPARIFNLFVSHKSSKIIKGWIYDIDLLHLHFIIFLIVVIRWYRGLIVTTLDRFTLVIFALRSVIERLDG